MQRMLRATLLTVALCAAPAWAAAPAQGKPDAGSVTEPEVLSGAEQAVAEASVGLRASMPPALRQRSVLGLQRWQWLGMPVLLLASWLLALALGGLTLLTFKRLVRRTRTTIDDAILERMVGPTRLLWLGLLGSLGVHLLALPAGADLWGGRLFGVLLSLGFFWGLSRAITTWSHRYLRSEHAAARPESKALVKLTSRVTQLAVLALAVLAVLSALGFSVTSVLAGLGIGGLALALGAQKTLENLFGGFALALDQPFREGDFVKVDDFVGTVENIGLRSTRIRTLDRTVVSVPNSKLADQRLETFAARDRYRLWTKLGLVYEATEAQVRQVRDGVEQVLRAHPKIWPDAVSVRFVEFADSSLDIEVMCWFLVKDYDEYKLVQEEVLLAFMRVIADAKTSMAYPTQTLYTAPVPGTAPRA